MVDKGIFLGIFEKSDGMIKFWSIFQAPFIVLCNLLLIPLFFSSALKKYHVGPISLPIYFVIAFLLAVVGLRKIWSMYRVFQKANKIMSRHKNKDLSKLFDQLPRILFAVFVLDIMLPFTWPVSFMVKFLFYKNLVNIKYLMYTREREDEA